MVRYPQRNGSFGSQKTLGWIMRVATFSIGGERRVGLVDAERQTIAAFDLPAHEADRGILALIEIGRAHV